MAFKNNPGLPAWKGRTLRIRRICAGMTLEDLAARVNVSKSTVSRWEQGGNSPAAEDVARLAEALEVPAIVFAKEARLR